MTNHDNYFSRSFLTKRFRSKSLTKCHPKFKTKNLLFQCVQPILDPQSPPYMQCATLTSSPAFNYHQSQHQQLCSQDYHQHHHHNHHAHNHEHEHSNDYQEAQGCENVMTVCEE